MYLSCDARTKVLYVEKIVHSCKRSKNNRSLILAQFKKKSKYIFSSFILKNWVTYNNNRKVFIGKILCAKNQHHHGKFPYMEL